MVKKISIRLRPVGGPRREDGGDGMGFKEVFTALIHKALAEKVFNRRPPGQTGSFGYIYRFGDLSWTTACFL